MASLVQVALVRVDAQASNGSALPVPTVLEDDSPCLPVTMTASDTAEMPAIKADDSFMGSNRRSFVWRIAVVGDKAVYAVFCVGFDEVAVAEITQENVDSYGGMLLAPGTHEFGIRANDEEVVILEAPAAV